MALAQPTGLQVQTLEPLIAVEQAVERTVAAGPLVTLNQYVDDGAATLDAGGKIVGVTQVVDDTAVIRPAETLVDVWQLVDDSAVRRPAQTLATLDQTIITESERPAQTLVSISQTLVRHAPTQPVIRLRQIKLVAA